MDIVFPGKHFPLDGICGIDSHAQITQVFVKNYMHVIGHDNERSGYFVNQINPKGFWN
jgi:hypothetical protein